MKNNESKIIEEFKNIAERTLKPNYFKDTKSESILNRMLPSCYTDFTFTNINVSAFNEETLFYIFYAIHDSLIQIKAYNEIINKGYYFSRMLDSFVLLSDVKIADNKKRTIIVFDPLLWEKVNKEIFFDDKFIKTLETHVCE